MKLICCICGMEISGKNMNVNAAAFQIENNEDMIEFCPFCGAKKEFLTKDIDSDKIQDTDELNSATLKILDHAVKLELFNSDFYKKASRLAKDIKVKEMFKDLAQIEYVHAKVHHKLGGFVKLPKLADISYDKYDNDAALLEQAMLREKHAVDYYRKYMHSVCSEEIKEVLKVLESVEKEHITLLSN